MQMYLSTLAVLITILSLRTSASHSKEYAGVEQHRWPPKLQTSAHPRVSVYYPEMPTLFYPLMHLPLTHRGKTQIPLPSSYEDEDEDQPDADKRRVPSHVKTPLVVASRKKQQHAANGTGTTHFSAVETHGEQINSTSNNSTTTTNGSDEEYDNAIGVEHLPTIAVPFLDTLTHGIISGVQQHVQLIKPGTKWCGEGNKARYYDDVGVLHKTDKCCRSHDRCPYYILSHETKFGLYNNAHFTRSHCDCDASFYDCLKKADSPFSHGVGITYFNILRMKCFRLEYPVVMCAQSTGWFSKHCVEYVVDMGKRKQWQWFDNHEF